MINEKELFENPNRFVIFFLASGFTVKIALAPYLVSA